MSRANQRRISLSFRPHFCRHVPQWHCPVRKRFSYDHWRRVRWKPGGRTVASFTSEELIIVADCQSSRHIYPDVLSHCLRIWQAEWDGCISSKLHCLKPLLSYNNLSGLSRQDAVFLRRLCIGHTRLTHSYHLNRKDTPQCSHCDCALTVKHFLLDCDYYRATRQRFFNVFTLKELFDTVSAHDILGFNRDAGLCCLM